VLSDSSSANLYPAKRLSDLIQAILLQDFIDFEYAARSDDVAVRARRN